jgi:hypothetical protein
MLEEKKIKITYRSLVRSMPTAISALVAFVYVLFFLFATSGCTHKFIEREYPLVTATGIRYSGSMPKFENEESLGDFIAEFCSRWSRLRAGENITAHECVRKSKGLKIAFRDGLFNPSKPYHDFEKDGRFPFRTFEGSYRSTGFIDVNVKGVNFGDTALAHELLHALDHMLGVYRACPTHEAHCGWTPDAWRMIDELDHFAGRGNHNWHGWN